MNWLIRILNFFREERINGLPASTHYMLLENLGPEYDGIMLWGIGCEWKTRLIGDFKNINENLGVKLISVTDTLIEGLSKLKMYHEARMDSIRQ